MAEGGEDWRRGWYVLAMDVTKDHDRGREIEEHGLLHECLAAVEAKRCDL
jgi:hypothetical protein